MYKNDINDITTDAIKNLYFFINDSPLLFPLFKFNESYPLPSSTWYNLPIKYDPKRVDTSNIIGTYPEYSLYPQSTRNAGVQNSYEYNIALKHENDKMYNLNYGCDHLYLKNVKNSSLVVGFYSFELLLGTRQ